MCGQTSVCGESSKALRPEKELDPATLKFQITKIVKIVVPMAGRGSRLSDGFSAKPKPLIEVCGRPMFAWSLDSLAGVEYSEIIFIVLRDHEREFGLSQTVREFHADNSHFVFLDQVTDGQLCTVLAARELIGGDDDLLITSCDTYVKSNLGREIRERGQHVRGLISVANLPGDKWSFAKVDSSGRVTEVAEKVRISDYASTGLYYFSNANEFIAEADCMIQRDERVRGEFYVIPAYQKYIDSGREIGISIANETWDMGTPDALAQAAVIFGAQQEVGATACAE
jgi:dTDP-glucose pyrophosphorylase